MVPENSNAQFVVERPDRQIVPLNQFLNTDSGTDTDKDKHKVKDMCMAQKVQTLQSTYLTKLS